MRLPNHQQQRLRPTLFTSFDEQVEWWREHVEDEDDTTTGAGNSTDMVVRSEGPHWDHAGDDGAQASVSAMKCLSAQELANTLLSDFCDDRLLDGIKERILGKSILKLLKLQHDIVNGPEAGQWAKKTTACLEAVCSAKQMVPPFLMYQKRFDSQSLLDLYMASQKLREYFLLNSMVFAPKLRVIFYRAEFQLAAQESLEGNLLKLNDAELLAVVGNDPEEAHALVSDCIANAITTYLGEEETQQKTTEATLRMALGATHGGGV